MMPNVSKVRNQLKNSIKEIMLDMKGKLWDFVLFFGVLCFIGGAAVMAFGNIGTPEKYALPAMIFIGAGASMKKRMP